MSRKAEIVVNRLGETDRGSADNVGLAILLDVSADFSERSRLVVDVVELPDMNLVIGNKNNGLSKKV